MIILFGVLFIVWLLFEVFYILYRKCGFLKWLFHDTFKLHIPNHRYPTFIRQEEGNCATCKYCGKNIIRDRFGDWYAAPSPVRREKRN